MSEQVCKWCNKPLKKEHGSWVHVRGTDYHNCQHFPAEPAAPEAEPRKTDPLKGFPLGRVMQLIREQDEESLRALLIQWKLGPSEPPAVPPAQERSTRQKQVYDWCIAAFGIDQASSVPQRGLRMLEEAAETAQSVGVNLKQAHDLLDYVWSRPPGEPFQELGGIGVTVLALAAALDVDADTAETTEIARVLSKPLEHFKSRNQAKNDAGFLAQPSPQPAREMDSVIRHLRGTGKKTDEWLADRIATVRKSQQECVEALKTIYQKVSNGRLCYFGDHTGFEPQFSSEEVARWGAALANAAKLEGE